MKVLNDNQGSKVVIAGGSGKNLWVYCVNPFGSFNPANLTRPMARKLASALLKWADEKKKGGKK